MTSSADEFLTALRPLAESFGATVISARSSRKGDQPVIWQGETIAYLRPNDLHGALERSVAAVEREVGSRVSEMDRSQKQMAIRLLDERGAFLLRGAAEDVASWMGVSKVTIYSYLNAIERADT